MNELLQKHGCSNVFTIPEGLKELMADISREVLRAQPRKIIDFITKYLSALLITREHGIMAVKILDELCDCRPTVAEHLLQLGLDRQQAENLATIIKNEIETEKELYEDEGEVREYLILKKVLAKVPLDEEMSAQVCQVARNAYRDYWYRKNLLKEGMKSQEEEPWQIAARHTLELYKKTKPSFAELNRATERIQAAYKGYHVRRHVLRHLLPKKDKREGREANLTGPPLDVAASREIDLGPVLDIRTIVKEDNVKEMFENEASAKLGLNYDPAKTITHLADESFLRDQYIIASSFITNMSPKRPGMELQVGDGYADETPLVNQESLLAAEISDEENKKKLRDRAVARISFSGTSPMVIGNMQQIAEVLEEPGACEKGRGLAGMEDAQEVPEDICVDHDADGVSESYDVSAPTTADLTDIEDVCDLTED